MAVSDVTWDEHLEPEDEGYALNATFMGSGAFFLTLGNLSTEMRPRRPPTGDVASFSAERTFFRGLGKHLPQQFPEFSSTCLLEILRSITVMEGGRYYSSLLLIHEKLRFRNECLPKCLPRSHTASRWWSWYLNPHLAESWFPLS